jgi:HEAT repeat protein
VGILDFIKPKSSLEKAAKQVREVYAQPDYRRAAMDKLLEIGTDEAYEALLKRFTITANGQIADEQEKKDLVEDLVRVGEPAAPAIERFLRSETKALTFPIRALVRIRDRAEVEETLLGILEGYEPLDHRSTQAKVSLIDALGGLLDADGATELLPYLDDHHDDVQASTIEVVEHLRPAGSAEALARICESDLHSSRIKRLAAKALANMEVSVRSQYEGFDPELKDAWILGKKGQLVARPHG